jgi:hypothetical protein
MIKALPSWAFQTHSHLFDLLAEGGRFPRCSGHRWRICTFLDAEDALVEIVQRREDSLLISHDVVLEPPRKPGSEVVLDGSACWDGEDIVELL